jgi:hypothetical protein
VAIAKNMVPALEALKTSPPAVTFSCLTRVIQRVRNYWPNPMANSRDEESVPKAEQGPAKKAKLG